MNARVGLLLAPALALAFATASASSIRPALPPHARIAIQPLGDNDPALVKGVAASLRSTFAVEVVVLPSRPLPASAYYRPRHRYRGEKLLADLEARTSPGVTKVIGLLASDLSVSKRGVNDWGVLGVAGLSRRAGVISSHRLGRHGAGREQVAKRLSRVATHELGHTLGLPHCPRHGCLMNDAGGTIRTVDRSTGRFCPSCRRRIAGWLR